MRILRRKSVFGQSAIFRFNLKQSGDEFWGVKIDLNPFLSSEAKTGVPGRTRPEPRGQGGEGSRDHERDEVGVTGSALKEPTNKVPDN